MSLVFSAIKFSNSNAILYYFHISYISLDSLLKLNIQKQEGLFVIEYEFCMASYRHLCNHFHETLFTFTSVNR